EHGDRQWFQGRVSGLSGPRSWRTEPYDRNASNGETRVARLTGIRHDASVTVASSNATPPSVTGSVAETPYTRAARSLEVPTDATRPIATPITVSSSAGPSTSLTMLPASAPRASRTPNSCLRWLTR